jgi:hypothetical protein
MIMCCPHLQVDFNDDCVPESKVATSCLTVPVAAGASYAIQVDGYLAATGSVVIMVSVPTPSSSNDFFAKYDAVASRCAHVHAFSK